MRFYCLIIFLFCLSIACISPRPAEYKTARKYQQHQIFEDTSFIYQLPYALSTSHRMVQGYYSRFTHKYKAAIDFKMKTGTAVYAARSGKVIRIKSDSNKGGWSKKYRPDANYIMIEHDDSTRASYRHLQQGGVLVKLNEYVNQGQHVAFSGNTGYTASPHLHFMVSKWMVDKWIPIPTRFQSKKEIGYLMALKKYESINSQTEKNNQNGVPISPAN